MDADKELERIRMRCVCEEDGCWLWTGSVTKNDIPTVNRRVDGKMKLMTARRWVYAFILGKLLYPRDMVVTTCENARCLNPGHLKKASRKAIQLKANADDGSLSIRRGAAIKAAWERKGKGHKLTAEQADYARDPSRPANEVAAELGVSHQLVNLIRAGKVWKPKANPMAFMAAQLAANDSSARRAA